MNPIKEMEKELNEAKRGLVKFEQLKLDHVVLIESSVELENKFNSLMVDVDKFCSNCPIKDTNSCVSCYLNKWLE